MKKVNQYLNSDEKWKTIQTNMGRKVFNSFFRGYKTCKDVSDELYPNKSENTKVIPEVSEQFNLFKQNGYLTDEKEDYCNVERRRKNKFGKVTKVQRYKKRIKVYRANLLPFFQWLDDRLPDQNDFIKISKKELKQYLVEFFDALDKQDLPRSEVLDNDSDIITSIQRLLTDLYISYVSGVETVNLPSPAGLFLFKNPSDYLYEILGIKHNLFVPRLTLPDEDDKIKPWQFKK